MNNKPVAWVDEDIILMTKDGRLTLDWFTVVPEKPFDEDETTWIPLYTHPVKENCCPDCGCHFTGEYPFNYTVKELTDDNIEIFKAAAPYYGIECQSSTGLSEYIKQIVRKAQEK